MMEGYRVKQYTGPVKRYCQTLSLRDDPALISLYRKAHSCPEFWPEILKGIKEVGILEMEIYLRGTLLFMIVETPLDFNWTEAMTRLATLPRQQEWEDYVARFQAAEPGLPSTGKWQPLERIFFIYE